MQRFKAVTELSSRSPGEDSVEVLYEQGGRVKNIMGKLMETANLSLWELMNFGGIARSQYRTNLSPLHLGENSVA